METQHNKTQKDEQGKGDATKREGHRMRTGPQPDINQLFVIGKAISLDLDSLLVKPRDE